MKRKIKIELLAFFILLILNGCIKDEVLKTKFNIDAIDAGDGWELSTPEAEGFDEIKFHHAITPLFSEDQYITSISLVVVRNNKLVAEAYVREQSDRYKKRQIQSITK